MKTLRSPLVTVALVLTACATGVNQDLPDDGGDGDGSAGTLSDGGMPGAAGTTNPGASGTLPTAGTTATNPFGGTGSTAGKSGGSGSAGTGGSAGKGTGGSAGKGTGGSGGASTAGSGGKASGGSGGKASGGSSGATGTSGTSGSGGSGGSGTVGTGSCDGTMAFAVGMGNKYPNGAKVVAVCNGGVPCTMASPAGATGKTYEFTCLDQYNCGSQDPGTTNWEKPPWQLTQACTP